MFEWIHIMTDTSFPIPQDMYSEYFNAVLNKWTCAHRLTCLKQPV